MAVLALRAQLKLRLGLLNPFGVGLAHLLREHEEIPFERVFFPPKTLHHSDRPVPPLSVLGSAFCSLVIPPKTKPQCGPTPPAFIPI